MRASTAASSSCSARSTAASDRAAARARERAATGRDGFDELLPHFDPPEHALRSVVRVDVEQVADSCGYGVPLIGFDSCVPDQYDQWVDKQVRSGGLDDYVAQKNAAESIERIPAIS